MEQIRVEVDALRWLSEWYREILAFWQDTDAVRSALGEDLARPSAVRHDLIRRTRFRVDEVEELLGRIGRQSQEEWETGRAARFLSAVDLDVVGRAADELLAGGPPLPLPTMSTLGTPAERQQYAAALHAMHTRLEAYLAANP